jgi:transmembrane sensor
MQDRIDEAAALWALRHPLDAGAEAELEIWLALDRRHSGALLRAMAALSVVERSVEPKRERAVPVTPYRPTRRWMLAGAGGAIAATVAGVVAWPHLNARRVTTARGEIRRLPLDDGSVATINTDSELRVAFADDTRHIALDRGQAWFQVAKDRTRPFVVDAGIAQVRAVGTAFSVTRGTEGVEITVTEGVVAVWASDASGAMTILNAGQFAHFSNARAQPDTGTAPAEIERALAWRAGEISLENETLGYAVEQFNRYNHRRLVIADPSLQGERLIGLFKIDRPEDFAATLAASMDVAVMTTPGEISLSRKKPTER